MSHTWSITKQHPSESACACSGVHIQLMTIQRMYTGIEAGGKPLKVGGIGAPKSVKPSTYILCLTCAVSGPPAWEPRMAGGELTLRSRSGMPASVRERAQTVPIQRMHSRRVSYRVQSIGSATASYRLYGTGRHVGHIHHTDSCFCA